MSDLIDRQKAIDALNGLGRYLLPNGFLANDVFNAIKQLPSEQPEIIRCKDCKHQEKFFQKDGRRKDGGYYIYGCSLAEGYSHVCLDDDYCSRAERRTDE